MITKTRLLIIGMILVSYPMAASSTFANSEGIETSDIFSSFKEWTSERMQHATPLGISNNSYKITRPVWHQTFGPYFSSSRLIPASANVVYPYSTVGKLFFSIPGRGDFYCSASVISYRIVLTAGHCLHDGSGTKNGFYTNFSFVPAYQNGVAPFLAWRGSYAAVTKAWF